MTNSYKILVGDRNYTEWNLYDASHLNEVDKINMNPSSNKLFSGDTFECDVDVDNLCKAVLDSCEGYFYENDKQVAMIRARKFYSINGRIEFELSPIKEAA